MKQTVRFHVGSVEKMGKRFGRPPWNANLLKALGDCGRR